MELALQCNPVGTPADTDLAANPRPPPGNLNLSLPHTRNTGLHTIPCLSDNLLTGINSVGKSAPIDHICTVLHPRYHPGHQISTDLALEQQERLCQEDEEAHGQ